MIRVDTRFLGVLECPEESVVSFPAGLPPFTDQEFVVIAKENSPFFFLQSVSTAGLCFIMLPVHAADPDYRLKLEPHDAESLGLACESPELGGDLAGFTLITIPEQGPMTANLAAPVLINTAKNVGVQAVRSDSTYSHTHPIDGGGEVARC